MDDLGSQLKGYTQVTEFEPDVDGEYEEEEVSDSNDVNTRFLIVPGFLCHDGLWGDGSQTPTQYNLSESNGATVWVPWRFIAHVHRSLGAR